MWRLKCILHHNLPLAIHGCIALNVPARAAMSLQQTKTAQKNRYCLTRELSLDKRDVKEWNVQPPKQDGCVESCYWALKFMGNSICVRAATSDFIKAEPINTVLLPRSGAI